MNYRITENWFSGSEPSLGAIVQRYNLLDRTELNILEIGSFEGMSTLWFYHNLLAGKKGEIYCIDTWKGGHDHQNVNWNQAESNFLHNIKEFQDRVTVVKGTSWDGLIGLQHLKEHFDLVFVDGSHMAHDVLNDLVLSFPLVKPGGFLFCDDYLAGAEQSDPTWSPKQGIDSFVQTYRSQLIPVTNIDNYVTCYIKKDPPDPKSTNNPAYNHDSAT